MSPRASRDGKEGRRSWRYAKSSSNATGSKKPYVAFLTLLLLGAVGLYLWAIWRTPNRNAHLAVIEVPANRRVPSTPFAHNDVRHLLDVKILRTREVWTDVRDNSDFADQVGPKAKGLLRTPYDKLLLYINAPGISQAGRAYLTHSDFLTPGAASEGRHEVSELLQAVAAAGEGLKLIVLDSTSVDVDPRLGLVVNEFVPLLAADVKALDKNSNLFVLIPAGPFQVSTSAYGDRQSLFGKHLAEGLAGDADRKIAGNGDLFITLYELYEYVRAGCAAEQTPVLLQAGVGYVTPSAALNTEQLSLTKLTGREDRAAKEPAEATEKQEPEKAAEEQPKQVSSRTWPARRGPALALGQAPAGNPDVPVESATEPKREPADTTPPAGPGTTVGETPSEKAAVKIPDLPPADAIPTPQEQLLLRLEKAWSLRDSIRDRKQHDVTPATFAPHLWREIEAELLFVERQVLADPTFDHDGNDAAKRDAKPVQPKPENVADVEELIGTLTMLQAAMTSSKRSNLPANARWRRLIEAWNRHLAAQLPGDAKFSSEEDPAVVQLAEQARDAESLIYSLPYYVRWHARARQSSASESYGDLKNCLEATVLLANKLSELRAMPKLSYREQGKLEPINYLLKEARAKQQKLDATLWEDDLGNPTIAERLLATPLLDAGRRIGLIRALIEAKPVAHGAERVPATLQDLSVTHEQWKRLHDHCMFEFQLVELALGQADQQVAALKGALDSIGLLIAADAADAAFWQANQQVGALFGVCLESLPKAILDDRAGDYALHIVDYRDVPPNGALDTRCLPSLRLNYELDEQIVIQAEEDKTEFDLKLNERRKLAILIRATRQADASRLPEIAGNDLLEVTPPHEAGMLRKMSGWFEQTAVYEIRAKDGVTQNAARESTELRFSLDSTTKILSFTLPRPDQISLEVLTASEPVQRERDSTLTLGVFPNNLKDLPETPLTEFQFRASNESGEKKKIRAELYVVKRASDARQKHGAIGADLRDKLLELFRQQADSPDLNQLGSFLELVAEAGEFELAVGASEVLAFKAPAAPAPADPPSAKGPQEKVPAPALRDVGGGMVCVLRDATSKPWVKWIQIAPAPLYAFLDAKASYGSGQVVVDVAGKLNREGYFPAGGLTLNWDVKPDFPTGANKLQDVITTPSDTARLHVDVAPDDVTREVLIGVNGCPRVLSFRIRCSEPDERGKRTLGRDTRIERRSIAITKLSILAKEQVFYVPIKAGIYLDEPPPDAKPPAVNLLKPGERMIVAPVDKLRVHLHLDTPVEGLNPDRDEPVEVLVGEEVLGSTYSDRHLSAHLSGIRGDGVIQLSMQMEEQYIDIEPRERDANLDLVAKLTVDRRLSLKSEVPVLFDGTAPAIVKVDVPNKIEPESKQEVVITVNDLAGVSAVRYWFSADPEATDVTPLKATLTGVPVREGNVHLLRFNVDAGKDEGEFFLLIQADDLVGNSRPPVRQKVRIEKKPQVPVLATIRGKIGFPAGRRLFTSVQLLKGDEPFGGHFAEKTDHYEFPNVPPGDYIVRATLIVDGVVRKKVDKPVAVTEPGIIPVDLNLK